MRVRGGTRVRELNALLDARGPRRCATWAATTRSRSQASSPRRRTAPGSRFGPFPDAVRSLDLVVAGGELVRVEPENGITDAEAFADRFGSDRTLVQDDDVFDAAVCGMGCMGIVDSLVLEVRREVLAARAARR